MSALSERYGTRRPIRKRWWVLGAATVLTAALGWMAWVAFDVSTLEARDITHSYNAERGEVSVTWNLTVKPGTPVACAVQALNPDFQVVGWKVVTIPASTEVTRQFTETFKTAMKPKAGLVYACWAS